MRILYVEDSPNDAALLQGVLGRVAPDIVIEVA